MQVTINFPKAFSSLSTQPLILQITALELLVDAMTNPDLLKRLTGDRWGVYKPTFHPPQKVLHENDEATNLEKLRPNISLDLSRATPCEIFPVQSSQLTIPLTHSFRPNLSLSSWNISLRFCALERTMFVYAFGLVVFSSFKNNLRGWTALS
jgi:hypothetical protein